MKIYTACVLAGMTLAMTRGTSLRGEVANCRRVGSVLPAGMRSSEHILSVRHDLELRTAWSVVVNCGHPEWPARMLLVPAGSITPSKEPLQPNLLVVQVVRAGETVKVWRHDSIFRIEMTGVAEAGGEVGKKISVRLLQRGTSAQEQVTRVVGIVREAGSVEMVQ